MNRIFLLLSSIALLTATAAAARADLIYFNSGDQILRIRTDGTEETVLVDGQPNVIDVAVDERNKKLVFSNGGTIFRANLADGANVTPIVSQGANSIAIDTLTDRMYWTNASEIWMSNTDGTDPMMIRDGLGAGYGLALDSANQHIYFTEEKSVNRIDYENKGFINLHTGDDSPHTYAGMTLDLVGQFVYWNDARNAGVLHKVDFDGENHEILMDTGYNMPHDLVYDPRRDVLYLTNTDQNKLEEFLLSDSSRKDLVTGKQRPTGIALSAVPEVSTIGPLLLAVLGLLIGWVCRCLRGRRALKIAALGG